MGSINGFSGPTKKGMILNQNPGSLTSPSNYQTQPQTTKQQSNPYSKTGRILSSLGMTKQ